MPRRIPDFPDMFLDLNIISTIGTFFTIFAFVYYIVVAYVIVTVRYYNH
jgi:hypothetical protein